MSNPQGQEEDKVKRPSRPASTTTNSRVSASGSSDGKSKRPSSPAAASTNSKASGSSEDKNRRPSSPTAATTNTRASGSSEEKNRRPSSPAAASTNTRASGSSNEKNRRPSSPAAVTDSSASASSSGSDEEETSLSLLTPATPNYKEYVKNIRQPGPGRKTFVGFRTSSSVKEEDPSTFWANFYRSRRKKQSSDHRIPRKSFAVPPPLVVRKSRVGGGLGIGKAEDRFQSVSSYLETHPKEDLGAVRFHTVEELERESLEYWWIRSPFWRQIVVLLLVLFFLLGLGQLAAGLYFISSSFFQNVTDPHICRTPSCLRFAERLKDSMNLSVSPCDNFYQFVCGKFEDRNDPGTFFASGGLFFVDVDPSLPDWLKSQQRGVWDLNTAKQLVGRQNVLAQILKASKGNAIHDQHIMFYKNCRDPRLRSRKEGLAPLRKFIVRVLGNGRNLTVADMSNLNAENVTQFGFRVFRVLGDVGLFTFEYAAYPNILISPRFPSWIRFFFEPAQIRRTMSLIFPDWDDSTLSLITSETRHVLIRIANVINFTVSLDTEDAVKVADVCPENDMLTEYLYRHENQQQLLMPKPHPLEFRHYVSQVEAALHIFTSCFGNVEFEKPIPVGGRKEDYLTVHSEDKQPGHIGYAGFWILYITFWTLPRIEDDAFEKLAKEWIELNTGIRISALIQAIERDRNLKTDIRCFQALMFALGHLPIHRLFEGMKQDPEQHEKETDTFVKMRMSVIERLWANASFLPHIPPEKRARGLHLLSMEDPLFITADVPRKEDLESENFHFLRNPELLESSGDGLQHVVNKRAKTWWRNLTGRTRPQHILLWNQNTFDVEKPHFHVKPYDDFNVLFIPLSFSREPYSSDILAVRNGGTTLITHRTLLDVLLRYVHARGTRGSLVGKGSTKFCRHRYFVNGTHVLENTTFADFYIRWPQTFNNVLALKAAHIDFLDRNHIARNPHNLTAMQRKWSIFNLLLGFEQFSEEGLFFIGAVRNFCRQPPSDPNFLPLYHNYITSINSALQHVKEFSDFFNCSANSFMNPPHKCF